MRLFVNASEREIIKGRAKATGLTVSAFLRAAALGTTMRPAPDLKAVDTLAKVNADMARLGNLLRFYLTDSKPDHVQAVRLLQDIGELTRSTGNWPNTSWIARGKGRRSPRIG